MTHPHPKPEWHNTRILRVARQFVTLPFVIAVAVYRWVRRLLRSGKSEKALYAEDQIRQSRNVRLIHGSTPGQYPGPAAGGSGYDPCSADPTL